LEESRHWNHFDVRAQKEKASKKEKKAMTENEDYTQAEAAMQEVSNMRLVIFHWYLCKDVCRYVNLLM